METTFLQILRQCSICMQPRDNNNRTETSTKRIEKISLGIIPIRKLEETLQTWKGHKSDTYMCAVCWMSTAPFWDREGSFWDSFK